MNLRICTPRTMTLPRALSAQFDISIECSAGRITVTEHIPKHVWDEAVRELAQRSCIMDVDGSKVMLTPEEAR